MKYRADIDGLRAIAVLSVVLCHAGLSFPGGYVGVDIFFVISGYLISRLMLKEIAAGSFSLADFWERRIRRIMPALTVVVVAGFVAGWFLLVPLEYAAFGKSVSHLATLRANNFFARDVGYFAADSDTKPLLHTWSLAVEEQFYLIAPLMFLLLLRRPGRNLLTGCVATLAIASFLLSVRGILLSDPKTYYLLITRAWELFGGMLTAIVAERIANASVGHGVGHGESRGEFLGGEFLGGDFLGGALQSPGVATERGTSRITLATKPWQRELLAATALAALVLPCFLYHDATPFPGLAALPIILGTSLLIYLGEAAERTTAVQRLLAWKPLVAIGLISYSLYLWHWPLLVFAKLHRSDALDWGERIGLVAASLVLAVITYRYVERPFRSRSFLPSRRIVFGGAFAVFACLMLSAQFLRESDGYGPRLPEVAKLWAETGKMEDRFLRDYLADDVPLRLMHLGDEQGEPELLVWGDSHAMAILPAIDELCRMEKISALGATHSSWPPVIWHAPRTTPFRQDQANAFSAAVTDYLASGKVRTVILAAYWAKYRCQPQFDDVLLETVDRLQASGVCVYFLRDVPAFSFDVTTVLIRNAWFGRDSSTVLATAGGSEMDETDYDSLVPRLCSRGVKILDPIPILQAHCQSPDIRPFDEGGAFYRDSNHLSTHGSLAIKPVFYPVFDAILVENSRRASRHDNVARGSDDDASGAGRLR